MKYENTCSFSQKTGKMTLGTVQVLMKVFLILFLSLTSCPASGASSLTPWSPSSVIPVSSCSHDKLCISVLQTTVTPPRKHQQQSPKACPHLEGLEKKILGKKQTSNFLAKYVNGNRVKGILNIHLNIRSLKNKVTEVRKLVKEHSPNIFGLSECELKKVNNQFDETKLKIPGYQILFPKSWAKEGYARVVVYVKKNLDFEQLHDLEDERVQSVWLKGGFKNGKKIYFCHGYREHTSSLGNSLSAQRSNLELFLNQWEMATEHNSPAEPHEIHVTGDMNLDCLTDRWLDPTYHLLSLSKMVQNTCNTHNFSQLVTDPTRFQFNNIQNKTEISCIDHLYTNFKHRCSKVTVTSFGDSDHDLISYIRYSKEPPAPARTIRKRSYKEFDEKKYLHDVAQLDWTDVLSCEDLDIATENLTRKLRYVLDVHAPWIIFQQRKFFVPWLTEDTKQLMVQRDNLKQVAKDLAIRDQGGPASEEQKSAWDIFKKTRNRVTNAKRNDEKSFKSTKISGDLDNPEKVWKTAKSFMGWTATGTPSQIEVGNKLETKPSRIAEVMNDFFIDKVITIRNGLKNVPENLTECWKLMRGKKCKMGFSHVAVSTENFLRN